MTPDWFRRRGYRHLDAPVGAAFAAKAMDGRFVARHDWTPLISYEKREKRYKPDRHKTVNKPRKIKYASHRDACILSYYASRLTDLLDARYRDNGLDEAVIAYRSLGKSNYDFGAAALAFAKAHGPCVVMCFDITGFFDNIDHSILKRALKDILGCNGLADDWFAVFKSVTKYRHVPLAALKANSTFAANLKRRGPAPIATIAEVKCAGIAIEENRDAYGIPQGTPISAVLSNLYMWNLDREMAASCAERGGFYQRYSDDILIICPLCEESELAARLIACLAALKLEIKDEKTDRAIYDPDRPETFQYLGFNISPDGAVIRPSSLGRQWRKARRGIRRTRRIGEAAITAGTADKIFKKKLRRRFSPIGLRNFSSYARRASNALESQRILRQVRRLERMVDGELDKFD